MPNATVRFGMAENQQDDCRAQKKASMLGCVPCKLQRPLPTLERWSVSNHQEVTKSPRESESEKVSPLDQLMKRRPLEPLYEEINLWPPMYLNSYITRLDGFESRRRDNFTSATRRWQNACLEENYANDKVGNEDSYRNVSWSIHFLLLRTCTAPGCLDNGHTHPDYITRHIAQTSIPA